ncbi:MAG TPA: prepilin-type N-terminal cleavage/methylation domain-containing protein [Methylophilaceae bacterium]|jgi:prepilin-type N-terminal cleavage/methylation domain-containing protein
MSMRRNLTSKRIIFRGFTLVEMAIVLVIIGLTIGTLTATISAQVEHRDLSETRNTLENIKESLLGYAMANGRLPCPAQTPGTGIIGVEYFSGGSPAGTSANGLCGQFYDGFVPAATLGLSPANTSGYILDAWNNPIRYAVFDLSDGTVSKDLLTATDGIKNANINGTSTDASCSTKSGMEFVGCMSLLYVCDASPTAAAGDVAADCGTATSLSRSTSSRGGVVFVVYSTGKNAATGGTGKDEAANPNSNSTNNDPVFVSHDPSGSGAAGGEFDDLMVWVSPNTIFARLVQANKLP